MDKSGAEAFVYSKACGILGHSFIGDRANTLFEVKSLSELWTLVSNSPVPMVPETVLAEKIEEEAFNKFIQQYIQFIDCFDKPDSYLSDQFIILEVENLKTVIDALCAGERNCPKHYDLGKYDSLHYECWPDIKKITENTEYDWLKELPDIHQQQQIEYKLDIQAIKHLWSSAEKVGGEEGDALRRLLEEEFILENIVWALRLKIHYGMKNEDIIPKLMYVTDAPDKKDPVTVPALKVLEKDIENYEQWQKWTYKKYLNPRMEGYWRVDPAWIESQVRQSQTKKAAQLFHRFPLSGVSLIGWYKIKQYELSCIRMSVEAVRLHSQPQL